MNYKPIIGLEVHVELKTKSKMFCSCKAEYFGQKPNSNTCPVCLGLPGALPFPNKKAIEWCVMTGLALNCEIPLFSKFDRKNYFYPDLPKGYQISQYDEPFCVEGFVILSATKDLAIARDSSASPQNDIRKRIGIRRVHMEEDTGKLMHEIVDDKKVSLIDFNRSGVPLVEIVTEPDFESGVEVVEYLKKLHQIVRYLGVSDADMEKGEMRLEPNISLHGTRDTKHEEAKNVSRVTSHVLPKYKVEVKNINSFRFVEKAINYEIERQRVVLDSGKTPVQETRGWDDKKQVTVTQRIKEEAMDYRYFPEPDIPPIRWTEDQIRQLANQMPELPAEKRSRFISEYKLSEYDADILINAHKRLRNLVETVIRLGKNKGVTEKQVVNYIMNKKIIIEDVNPESLLTQIQKTHKTVTIDEEKLKKIINEILEKNLKAVNDYKSGKIQAIGFLIGKVKQAIKQPLDTKQVKNTIDKLINRG